MKVTIEDNNNLRHFLKKNKKFAKEIENNIFKNLPTLIKDKPYKIKNAGKVRHLGHQALEYKISLGKETFRAAFIYFEEQIIVFFISDKTVKEQFMLALEKTIQN